MSDIPFNSPVALPSLSPGQRVAYRRVLSLLPKGKIVGLICSPGCGRTTILNQLSEQLPAHIVRLADVFEQIKDFHPLQLEEGIARTLLNALKEHDRVIVDDYHIMESILYSCYSKARPNVLRVALDAVVQWLEEGDKQLILGLGSARVSEPMRPHLRYASVADFTPEDFSFLFHAMGGDKLAGLDYERIHAFAPRLNAHQMRLACHYLEKVESIDTQGFMDFLEAYALVSNVNTQEVEEVSLDSLHGVEEVIRQLEIDIINPIERDDLVKELGIRPKRGVLLYGPPGTGKTTIGRALAHRLRSKFFLIDGTVISGTSQFYNTIFNIFQAAKDNAPSILFIDDCDLFFENEEEPGLYRYLLTMLDGLESKGNSQVTILLTAMNIGSLPPALIRSGRVELWLEMKLPDTNARAAIIRSHLDNGKLQLAKEEIGKLAEQTTGLTGADLRRVVADAHNLYGFDVAKETELKPVFSYFEQAIRQLLKHRQQLASAPAYTAAHHPAGRRRRKRSKRERIK